MQDIRLIEWPNGMVQLALVQYNEDGTVKSHDEIKRFDEIGEAFQYTDSIYQASLKPTLEMGEKGDYL